MAKTKELKAERLPDYQVQLSKGVIKFELSVVDDKFTINATPLNQIHALSDLLEYSELLEQVIDNVIQLAPPTTECAECGLPQEDECHCGPCYC